MPEKTRTQGQARYDAYWAPQMVDPAFRAVYAEEAAKKELWLQLVEAREAAGLTRAELADRLGVSEAQVARSERRGYESCSLNTLRRYVDALGEGFSLTVSVTQPTSPQQPEPVSTAR
jgi:DNA-binding XRE family transcriptional regulator